MFWKFNHASSPHIETLLSKEDVTLRELMEEDDILQECKVQNKKLIDFLVRPDVMEDLVTLITVEPSGDIDENTRYKYANIACELLTCDVPTVNERLAGDETLLGKLYSFLESDKPLNPLLASFFSKTLGILVARKSEQNWYSYQFTCLQVLEFLKSKENCVPLLLKNLGTSAIMDLTLKLISQVEGNEMRQNILSWLDTQHIVQNLVALFDPSVDSDRHCNASQLLCDIIRISRDNQGSSERLDPDPILNAIESPETISQLLNIMLNEKEKSETSIVGGIGVLLSLLDCGKGSDINRGCLEMNNPYGNGGRGDDSGCSECEQPTKVVQDTISAILPRLKDFHNLLVEPPSKPAVKTTAGILDPPLGNTRLQVARLFAALISTCSSEINIEVAKLGTVEFLLDLFFKYTWNNFLHSQVEQCIAFALNTELSLMGEEDGYECMLLEHIFLKCKLLQRILEAWDDNENQQSKMQGRRRGYMGHLIKIANHVARVTERGLLNDFLKEHIVADIVAAWDAFVANSLAETNKSHTICLGGVNPVHLTPDCEDQEYRDIPFSQDGSTHQLQQITAPQFIENYTFREDDFTEADEEFHMSDDDAETQAERFERLCAQKSGRESQNNEDEADDEDECWNDRDLTYRKSLDTGKKRNWPDDPDLNSSDEEDKAGQEGEEDTSMDIDPADAWSTMAVNTESSVMPVLGAVDPWNTTVETSSQPSSIEGVGWATFDTNFDAGFGNQEANKTKEEAVSDEISSVESITSSSPPKPCQESCIGEGSSKVSELSLKEEVSSENTIQIVECSEKSDEKMVEESLLPSDDNANPRVEDENKIYTDNYRFLTTQEPASESDVPSLQPHTDISQENGPVLSDDDNDSHFIKTSSKPVSTEQSESQSSSSTPNGPI